LTRPGVDRVGVNTSSQASRLQTVSCGCEKRTAPIMAEDEDRFEKREDCGLCDGKRCLRIRSERATTEVAALDNPSPVHTTQISSSPPPHPMPSVLLFQCLVILHLMRKRFSTLFPSRRKPAPSTHFGSSRDSLFSTQPLRGHNDLYPHCTRVVVLYSAILILVMLVPTLIPSSRRLALSKTWRSLLHDHGFNMTA
jgi:hypothetical protein